VVLDIQLKLYSVTSLKTKFKKAVSALEDSSEVFQELDLNLDNDTRTRWSQQEQTAMQHRGDYLKIYSVDDTHG
jgi:hypothetical protein